MRRLIFCIAIALGVVSCLDGGTYSQSYVADITFEFTETVYENDFKDSVYVMTEGDSFLYMMYPLFFYQKHSEGNFHGGFLMSCLEGEKDGALLKEPASDDVYRVNNSAGAGGSKTYAVFYQNPVESMMPQHDIEFGYKSVGTCTPYGCYVNNTTQVAREIREHFTEGDKLVLKAKGTASDGTVSEASIVLAEYTSAKDTVMCNWTAFDLQNLGNVEYIDFEIESSCEDIPAYFCLDGLMAGIKVEYE